jgi:putative oxidoreductase
MSCRAAEGMFFLANLQKVDGAVSGLNDLILLVARLAMGALYVPSGITKIFHFAQFSQSLAQKGTPYPTVIAAVAIAAEAGGGLALVAGIWPRYTALLLLAFTIAATGLSHRYWTFEGAERRAQEINFYKNVAIMGGILFYSVSGAGRIRMRVG